MSNCSSQNNMSNMLTIREVMSMTSSQTSLASIQVFNTLEKHPTSLCSQTIFINNKIMYQLTLHFAQTPSMLWAGVVKDTNNNKVESV